MIVYNLTNHFKVNLMFNLIDLLASFTVSFLCFKKQKVKDVLKCLFLIKAYISFPYDHSYKMYIGLLVKGTDQRKVLIFTGWNVHVSGNFSIVHFF